MSQRAGPGNTRKRGHQHHPRNHGTRGKRTTLEATAKHDPNITTKENNVTLTDEEAPKSVILSASVASAFLVDKSKSDIIDLTDCDDEEVIDKRPEETFVLTKTSKDEQNSRIRKHAKNNNNNNNSKTKDMSLVFRPAAEGSSQSDQEAEDPEIEELARLRCPSERAEVVAERETRRRNRRCADYPGLAFGSSIFSSDTLMKFSIIRNELHNIMNTQLKRVC